MINYKTIHFAGEEIKYALDEMRINEDFIDDFGQIDCIEAFLAPINIIVTFGEGTWGGFFGEFVLIYHQEKEKFFWIRLDTDSENLEIRLVEENDLIFSILDKLHLANEQYDEVTYYFEGDYEKLLLVTAREFLDSPSYDADAFFVDVWWMVQRHLHVTIRKRFVSYVHRLHTLNRKKDIQEFINRNDGKPVSFSEDNGRLFVIFPNGEKKELIY